MFLIKLPFICYKNIILYVGEDKMDQSRFEFVAYEKKITALWCWEENKYLGSACLRKKILGSQFCWKKIPGSDEKPRPPPESQMVAPLVGCDSLVR